MSAVLEFEEVSKHYRSLLGGRTVQALDRFSLSIERGEVFGFLGPNGAGKSTAIHLALGFMRPTAGRGRMLGREFGHAPTRARVGFLPENVALYHRPAGRLLRFYGGLNRVAEPRLSQRARALLAELGLAGEAGRNAGKFSRGMAQRLGLAQALVNDPELLILDEPASALDPLGRIAVRELLRRLRAEGKTVFLSSHLLSEVELVCDRIAVLHRGRLARLGRTADLLQSGAEWEVVARGVSAGDFAGAVDGAGVVRFTVAAAGQRRALERVWAAGGEIVSVNPVRRSLEEIFLELVGDAFGPGASSGGKKEPGKQEAAS